MFFRSCASRDDEEEEGLVLCAGVECRKQGEGAGGDSGVRERERERERESAGGGIGAFGECRMKHKRERS